MNADEFFEKLEREIKGDGADVEPIAFEKWEEKGNEGFHSKKWKYGDCRHEKKTLNDEARMIQCNDCNAFLDPYDCLKRLVVERQRSQDYGVNLTESVNDLRKKEHSLKKRIEEFEWEN